MLNNIEDYKDLLLYLPPNIKDRLLRRVQTMPISNKNKLYLYEGLLHRDVNVLNFNSTHVTDELINIVRRCENLFELTLTSGINTHNISSKALIDLVSSVKKLRIFRCYKCPAINDEVVTVLVKELPHITYLDISQCSNITDISLFELSKLSNLRGLRVTNTNVSIL